MGTLAVNALTTNNEDDAETHIEADYTQLVEPHHFDVNPQLSVDEQKMVTDMLMDNLDAFAIHPDAPPTTTDGVEHSIHLLDEAPIKQRPYRLSPEKLEFVRHKVKEGLAAGTIRPSHSPWSSPVVIVPKHSGELRMCIDYRKLNAKTKKDAYPMPLIEDCLNMCKDAKFLTIIDIQEAYYHIRMAKDSRAKTAFCTADGLWEWLVMPFGLCNAPATFQRHVDFTLREHIGKICAAFFDDIVVFTNGDLKQHCRDVEKVLQTLARAKLSAKVKKCKFAYKEIIFVGHLVKEGRVYPDPSKLEAIKAYPAPTNTTELKSFVGLANYYRKFIKGYALIAKPTSQERCSMAMERSRSKGF